MVTRKTPLRTWNHIFSGFCGMALMGIIWFAMSSDSSKLLTVSVGEATLEMQADNMEIGVPEARPPEGRAYACRDGLFWRRTVRLTNLDDDQRFVRVEVTAGHYPCVDPTAPQIQLSEADAASLFGGPTRRIERAEAIVVD